MFPIIVSLGTAQTPQDTSDPETVKTPLAPVALDIRPSHAAVDAPPLSLPSPQSTPSRHVRLETISRRGAGFVAELEGGGHADLTLDPRLQNVAEDVFRSFQIPYGAAVVVSVPDGRVLALAGRSTVAPELGPEELALHAWAPAASVFKLVSAAALVSEAGLSAQSRTCYHGGLHAVLPENLVDNPRLDRRCDTLGYGLGKSQNAILAKLATHNLMPSQLDRVAHSFGFGETIPFEVPVEPSHIDVPTDNKLEFARAAAGFWHSTLSPLHGALLAAAVANNGEMPAPYIIERNTGNEDQPVARRVVGARTVMTAAVAHEVGSMMELTTRIGTARSEFVDRQGRSVLPVSVAGKTGTLSAVTDKGFVRYSWFVGYAPADHPRIAFAVALGKQASKRIKATYLGRRLVEEYLAGVREQDAARVLAAAR
jgi:peptidoglycan glycosyltransferase